MMGIAEKGIRRAIERELAMAEAEQAKARITRYSYEYAVQVKTFIDGDYDRTYTRSGLTSANYTKEEAEEQVEAWNRSRPEDIARVVKRQVTDWEPA